VLPLLRWAMTPRIQINKPMTAIEQASSNIGQAMAPRNKRWACTCRR